MKINTYTIDDLQAFLKSESYKKSANLPVSPHRVVSYMNNPRADGSMPVLFTREEDGQVIAYRTLLPDHFYKGNTIKPFAWLSGNFVSPEHRRTGISTSLFKAVEEAWQGRLMYTNYAPASKAVYDKTGVFNLFLEKPGLRFYLRSSMQSLLKDRLGESQVLAFGDNVLNKLHDGRIENRSFALPDDMEVELIDLNGDELADLIAGHSSQSLFRRGLPELSWIYNSPWLTTEEKNETTGNYHFSWRVETFENFLYQIKDKTKGDTAFLWISVHNDKLSVPYFFSSGERMLIAARHLVLQKMLEYKCSYVTVWHPDLGPALKSRKGPFLLSKKIPQRYFVHDNLKGELPGKITLFDGDGDCAFS